MKPGCKLAWIVLFAVAMGYLESSVVIYLRALYYPEGFNFPLKPMAPSVVITELYREAATLIMILSISVLAAQVCLVPCNFRNMGQYVLCISQTAVRLAGIVAYH
jgi:hypothetical protein